MSGEIVYKDLSYKIVGCLYEVYNELERQGGKITVLEKAQDFGAVGQFYNEFEQTDDETVIKILKKYRRN